MTHLIIEQATRTEELSTGIHTREIPTVRYIILVADEETGAKSVHDIIEQDAEFDPAFVAMSHITKAETIEFRDIHVPIDDALVFEGKVADFQLTYLVLLCYMMAIHARGYTETEGQLIYPSNEDKGGSILQAYRANSDGDAMPYRSVFVR